MDDKNIISNNKIRCHGCIYFYITFKKERPWGCKKFGFISKFMPSSEVYNTTGTECAYRIDKNLNNKIL
ncbi:MAG: hypothetical protein O3A39_01035 [Proteobacteria bacterium]|jgi:hypothetical protein|nr:hypothetical protein [Pseudomonadota bacterium]MDA1135964.1 hypothetical protein [Pseudomonadota bacterium]|tara:strand:- start:5 stop:211 length:207 start_codon:yes stop_codon:yes gene_type:complete